jgi:hypothetical protein
MKKLYKVVATKKVPLLVYSGNDLTNVLSSWKELNRYLSEEEDNLVEDDIHFDVVEFNASAPLDAELKNWAEGSLVYHEGGEDIPLSEARMRVILKSMVFNLTKMGISSSEAEKTMLDTIQAIMEE